jgi:hypothetical protein
VLYFLGVFPCVRVYRTDAETHKLAASNEGPVKQFEEATQTEEQLGCTEQLAKFFPGATRIRVPVQITALRAGASRLREASVVEFATLEHAIFASGLPLEFDDKVRLEGNRKAHAVDGEVVAVQYHDDRKAVAIRFLRGECHWMMHS